MLYNPEQHGTFAEIPYGFKNLWTVSVKAYDLEKRTFRAADVLSASLNGMPVTADQIRVLYDYNRDGCGLDQGGVSGVYVTLTGYYGDSGTFGFRVLIKPDIDGILSISGDMVDSSSPLQPVILHDAQKVDVSRYEADQALLDARIVSGEDAISHNATDIAVLKNETANINTVLGTKADANAVTEELAKKADADAVNTELAKKADNATMLSELGKKADANTVATELAKKADAATIESEFAQETSARQSADNDIQDQLSDYRSSTESSISDMQAAISGLPVNIATLSAPGIVKSSQTDLEILVAPDGTMSVNNLAGSLQTLSDGYDCGYFTDTGEVAVHNDSTF